MLSSKHSTPLVRFSFDARTLRLPEQTQCLFTIIPPGCRLRASQAGRLGGQSCPIAKPMATIDIYCQHGLLTRTEIPRRI